MKLIYCPICYDVVALTKYEWRQCRCKASGGMYQIDEVTATVGGVAHVFGIGNAFFDKPGSALTAKERKNLYVHKYGLKPESVPKSDIWWAPYKDPQVEHVHRSDGKIKGSVIERIRNRFGR